jgi:hypothetical protein
VEAEHEREVVGQTGEKGHLGRARVREQRGQIAAAEEVERGVADGAGHGEVVLGAIGRVYHGP